MHNTLKYLFPNAPDDAWSLQDDLDGNGAYISEWNLPDAQPTQAEMNDGKIGYEAHLASTQYQRDRVLEYPSIGDQLDMIYHSGLGGPEFQAAIKAVKDAHPKGGN
jgi:hypothetical protein